MYEDANFGRNQLNSHNYNNCDNIATSNDAEATVTTNIDESFESSKRNIVDLIVVSYYYLRHEISGFHQYTHRNYLTILIK